MITSLNPSALSILHAVFGLGLLSLVMGIWMSLARQRGMQQAGLTLQDGTHTVELQARLPSSVRQVADNYNHLFEAPTVFYAVALAIVMAGIADPFYAVCAWAFVALRAVHSLVQATFNAVPVRATIYGLSWLPLAIMIVRPLMAFFLALFSAHF
jgi:hypothetical protein